MPIFSQIGEIVWQRLFNIVRILQTTALKVTNEEFYLVNAAPSVDLGLTRLFNTNDSTKTAVHVCLYLCLIVLC